MLQKQIELQEQLKIEKEKKEEEELINFQGTWEEAEGIYLIKLLLETLFRIIK